jgi:hypothetical protein
VRWAVTHSHPSPISLCTKKISPFWKLQCTWYENRNQFYYYKFVFTMTIFKICSSSLLQNSISFSLIYLPWLTILDKGWANNNSMPVSKILTECNWIKQHSSLQNSLPNFIFRKCGGVGKTYH